MTPSRSEPPGRSVRLPGRASLTADTIGHRAESGTFLRRITEWPSVLLVSMSRWIGCLVRALSLRVILTCLIGGVGFGVLAGLVWPAATMPVVWTTAGALYLVAVFNAALVLRCAACGKRVKLGSSRCHHCGYQP